MRIRPRLTRLLAVNLLRPRRVAAHPGFAEFAENAPPSLRTDNRNRIVEQIGLPVRNALRSAMWHAPAFVSRPQRITSPCGGRRPTQAQRIRKSHRCAAAGPIVQFRAAAEVAQAAEQAQAALNRYLDRCGLAANTVRACRRQAAAYVGWLAAHAADHPDAFTDTVGAEAAVTRWHRHLLQRKASPASVNQALAAVTLLYEHGPQLRIAVKRARVERPGEPDALTPAEQGAVERPPTGAAAATRRSSRSCCAPAPASRSARGWRATTSRLPRGPGGSGCWARATRSGRCYCRRAAASGSRGGCWRAAGSPARCGWASAGRCRSRA